MREQPDARCRPAEVIPALLDQHHRGKRAGQLAATGQGACDGERGLRVRGVERARQGCLQSPRGMVDQRAAHYCTRPVEQTVRSVRFRLSGLMHSGDKLLPMGPTPPNSVPRQRTYVFGTAVNTRVRLLGKIICCIAQHSTGRQGTMAAEFPIARLTSNQLTCSERDEAYRRLHAVISGIQQRLLGDPDQATAAGGRLPARIAQPRTACAGGGVHVIIPIPSGRPLSSGADIVVR